jgi:hypothetical protein
MPASRLREVFLSVMEQSGGKFVYSRASQTAKHKRIKEAIELLVMAGLVYPVTHTSATGIPLAAKLNHKFCKYIVFDTGVMQRFMGLDISHILLGDSFSQINKGSIAEIFAGLEIHTEYGRIRRNAAADPWKWDYFLKDHLGNVRVVLEAPASSAPSAQSNTILYMATMEESKTATEDTYFADLDETRADRPYNYPDKNLLNAKLAKVPGKSKGLPSDSPYSSQFIEFRLC